MTEVQQGPTPGVRFREVSVKRESTVSMRVLIGYSSLGYPVIYTGLQNTMDARASNHLYSRVLTDKFIFCHWFGICYCYFTCSVGE